MLNAKPIALLATLVVLGSIAFASSVQAHSRPVRFDPAPGAVLNSGPTSITGWFTSDIRRTDESFIKLLDHDGTHVATGDVELSDDRRQMSVTLPSDLGEGRYVVHWSTFDDADGEVFSDCYAFFVGQAAADDAVEHGESLDAAADCPKDEEHSHDGDTTDGDPTVSTASVEVRVTVTGQDAELTLLPINFTPRNPDGSTVDPNFGHYHIYLDKVPVDVIAGTHAHGDDETHADDNKDDDHDAGTPDDAMTDRDMDDDEAGHEFDGGLVENPAMWVENSFTLTDLEPGVHTVSVVLNHDDHTPLSPAVIASESFAIGGGSGDDGIPVWALALGVVGGLVVGGAGMKLVGGRS